MFASVLATSYSLSPALAFLEGIGAGEMVLVAIIGLLLFGGKGLPDMARTLGRVVREFKKATQGVENEVKRVMNEEPEPPRPRPRPTRPAPSAALPAPTVEPSPPAAAPAPTAPLPSRPPADQAPGA